MTRLAANALLALWPLATPLATPRTAPISAPSAAQVSPAPSADAPRAAAELLAADRSLGSTAPTRRFAEAIGAMLADDAVMPSPAQSGFAERREAILATLLRDSLNADSRVQWTPLRAGASADGTHGLTIGVMTVTRADGSALEYKYLAYWVRGASGWRARVWRRLPRARGALALTPQAPWLPRIAAERRLRGDALERARAELQAMEQLFSDSAARIGIGPAFEAFGADDAVHLGSPADSGFTHGNRVIARAVQGDAPATWSPVTWSAERSLLAPSGDLGVNLGYIVPNDAAPDGSRRRIPFFTIWRKEPGGWKYIAE